MLLEELRGRRLLIPTLALSCIHLNLQDDVKIGQGAVGSHEKAPPEHRVDPSNPGVDTVSFGLRIVFHDRASLSDSNASALPCPRFEMLSRTRGFLHNAPERFNLIRTAPLVRVQPTDRQLHSSITTPRSSLNLLAHKESRGCKAFRCRMATLQSIRNS
jgi:hypothetical protein